MDDRTDGRTGLARRLASAAAATAVALGIGLATAGAAQADEIPPPLTEPGQSNPSTSIQPPGSPSNPAAPDMDAIHQDILP